MRNLCIVLLALIAIANAQTSISCNLKPFTVDSKFPTNVTGYSLTVHNYGTNYIKLVPGTSWQFLADSSLTVPTISVQVDQQSRSIYIAVDDLNNSSYIKSGGSSTLIPSVTVLLAGLAMVLGSNKRSLLFLGIVLCLASTSVMAFDACNTILITYPTEMMTSSCVNCETQATRAPRNACPTPAPSAINTPAPTQAPTLSPTQAPTQAPTAAPTQSAINTPAPTHAPTWAPTPAPTQAAPTQAAPTQPPPIGATTKPTNGPISGTSGQFGQLLMAYYSGVGLDTVGAGGLNALAIAFFDPTPLGSGTCDFTNVNTPCIVPASGAGSSLSLAWALNVFSTATPLLSANTAPVAGGKPTIYFSFGGQSQGGACWDTLFANEATATTFGTNAAKLVTTVYNTIGQTAFVGFDLDIEGTSTTLPYLPAFVNAFRAIAPYSTFPLQMCALSGLADPSNGDNFKVAILQQVGPAQGGINFLNMMVANLDESCSGMSAYWLAPALNFIPPGNKIFGMWGELLPSWILHEPGCTTGSSPLYTYMQQYQIGIGIWQWWSGTTADVTAVISQIKS